MSQWGYQLTVNQKIANRKNFNECVQCISSLTAPKCFLFLLWNSGENHRKSRSNQGDCTVHLVYALPKAETHIYAIPTLTQTYTLCFMYYSWGTNHRVALTLFLHAFSWSLIWTLHARIHHRDKKLIFPLFLTITFSKPYSGLSWKGP